MGGTGRSSKEWQVKVTKLRSPSCALACADARKGSVLDSFVHLPGLEVQRSRLHLTHLRTCPVQIILSGVALKPGLGISSVFLPNIDIAFDLDDQESWVNGGRVSMLARGRAKDDLASCQVR